MEDESPPSCVSARGITKRFGSVVALDDIDLELDGGDVVALLGHNGAGKSTLLRVLATTVLPDHGSAAVAGHDLVKEPAAVREAVSVMFGNERSWYWRLTGRQNLEFFTILHRFRRRAAAEHADRLLREVGLEEAADRPFLGYSSGMRARLSLARALITEPRLLLLDEPSQSLDAAASNHLVETVRRLSRERGAGVLFATHDVHEAAAVATRTVVLRDGRIDFEARGTPAAEELEAVLLRGAPG
jgi:ABC-2 type transport system ATP-binding protein